LAEILHFLALDESIANVEQSALAGVDEVAGELGLDVFEELFLPDGVGFE
jgi:hypothetical protein